MNVNEPSVTVTLRVSEPEGWSSWSLRAEREERILEAREESFKKRIRPAT